QLLWTRPSGTGLPSIHRIPPNADGHQPAGHNQLGDAANTRDRTRNAVLQYQPLLLQPGQPVGDDRPIRRAAAAAATTARGPTVPGSVVAKEIARRLLVRQSCKPSSASRDGLQNRPNGDPAASSLAATR